MIDDQDFSVAAFWYNGWEGIARSLFRTLMFVVDFIVQFTGFFSGLFLLRIFYGDCFQMPKRQVIN